MEPELLLKSFPQGGDVDQQLPKQCHPSLLRAPSRNQHHQLQQEFQQKFQQHFQQQKHFQQHFQDQEQDQEQKQEHQAMTAMAKLMEMHGGLFGERQSFGFSQQAPQQTPQQTPQQAPQTRRQSAQCSVQHSGQYSGQSLPSSIQPEPARRPLNVPNNGLGNHPDDELALIGFTNGRNTHTTKPTHDTLNNALHHAATTPDEPRPRNKHSLNKGLFHLQQHLQRQQHNNHKQPSNGLTNNGQPNNGLSNNGLSNHGQPNNGLSNHGQPNNGLSSNGLSNNGLSNNGLSNSGQFNNGLTNNGLTNNGLPDDNLPNNNLHELNGFNQQPWQQVKQQPHKKHYLSPLNALYEEHERQQREQQKELQNESQQSLPQNKQKHRSKHRSQQQKQKQKQKQGQHNQKKNKQTKQQQKQDKQTKQQTNQSKQTKQQQQQQQQKNDKTKQHRQNQLQIQNVNQQQQQCRNENNLKEPPDLALNVSPNNPFDNSLNRSFNESINGSFSESLKGSFDGPFDRSFNGSLDGSLGRIFDGSLSGSLNELLHESFNDSLNDSTHESLNGPLPPKDTVKRPANNGFDNNLSNNMNNTTNNIISNNNNNDSLSGIACNSMKNNTNDSHSKDHAQTHLLNQPYNNTYPIDQDNNSMQLFDSLDPPVATILAAAPNAPTPTTAPIDRIVNTHTIKTYKNDRNKGEISLRQWIYKSKPKEQAEVAVPEFSSNQTLKYIKKALPVALKLTKCLESDETYFDHLEQKFDTAANQRKPIQPQDIVTSNVLLIIGEIDPLMEPLGFEDDINDVVWDELIENQFSEKNLFTDDDLSVSNSLHNAFDTTAAASSVLNNNGQDKSEKEEEDLELVEHVKILSNSSTTSSIISYHSKDRMTRLFALGVILYELFSRQTPPFEQEALNHIGANTNDQTLGGISLGDSAPMREVDASGSDELHNSNNGNNKERAPFARRRKQRKSPGVRDVYSKSVAQLSYIGVPTSLCTLISNLLDCRRGEFSGDDAYKSIYDVHLDLELMLEDPSRFLEDVKAGAHPTFLVCDKLYGREKEIVRIEQAYSRCCRDGACGGAIITGEAGIGKSKLAMHIHNLTTNANGYFVSGKFDQNQDIKPLSIIGSAFNYCCEVFVETSSQEQKRNVAKALTNALGSQATVLVELLPSLSKILPSLHADPGATTNHCCVNSVNRISYLFCILVQLLSSLVSRPITLFLDDLQWADQASLLLLRGLLGDAMGKKYLFFAGCFRDDEVTNDHPILSWLHSVSEFSIEHLKLGNLDPEKVNRLVSDTLHLSPRLTRPLSSVLHHKTRGNPLFIHRILNSLKDEGYLHLSLSPTVRWKWDLEKISSLKIADDVVSLLTREMSKLEDELQLGLKVASCMGGSIEKEVLDILSNDVGVDLRKGIEKVSEKGFMDHVGSKYTFVHDRVQQAAYEMMSPQQRSTNHVRFGLAICAHALNETRSDDMFFIAVNQINRGGPQALPDPSRKSMVASLNLQAGKRSIVLSDFISALKFFEHGISFLNEDHWESQYDLSIKLFDATAEAACVVNNSAAVKRYSQDLLTHSRCFDDKLNTLYVVVKALRHAELLQDAKRSAFEILEHLGEVIPPPLGDTQLRINIQKTSDMLGSVSDEFILNLKETKQKKLITLMKLYHDLIHVLQLIEPFRIGAISLRMVQLTLTEGLCSVSPLAFAYFGITLISLGDPTQAYRLGTLTLRLLEKLNAIEYTSGAVATVHQYLSWTSEPIQTIAEAHLLGYKAGKQSGDSLFAGINRQFFIMSSYVSGENLGTVKKNSYDFIEDVYRQNQMFIANAAVLIYASAVVLIEGPGTTVTHSVDLPTEENMCEIAIKSRNSDLSMAVHIHRAMRAFYLRKYDEMSQDANIYNSISEINCPLRIVLVVGIFFEGLNSFCMARRSKETKWMKKGETALATMKHWSQFSSWNFENKTLLLQAENMFVLRDYEKAAVLYEDAIGSAREHKFIHEEGIACELAGWFYYERKMFSKALEFFTNSYNCYRKWGAVAVSKRIENFLKTTFHSNSFMSSSLCMEEGRVTIAPRQATTKKRRDDS